MKPTEMRTGGGGAEWSEIRALRASLRRNATEEALILTRPRQAAPKALILDSLHAVDD